jgi:hypothetical protein
MVAGGSLATGASSMLLLALVLPLDAPGGNERREPGIVPDAVQVLVVPGPAGDVEASGSGPMEPHSGSTAQAEPTAEPPSSRQ